MKVSTYDAIAGKCSYIPFGVGVLALISSAVIVIVGEETSEIGPVLMSLMVLAGGTSHAMSTMGFTWTLGQLVRGDPSYELKSQLLKRTEVAGLLWLYVLLGGPAYLGNVYLWGWIVTDRSMIAMVFPFVLHPFVSMYLFRILLKRTLKKALVHVQPIATADSIGPE